MTEKTEKTENRGKKEKITAAEVLEWLVENDQLTAKELADELNCHPVTIRKKVKTLRRDGEVIVHNRSGYKHITKEELLEDDGKSAHAYEDTLWWSLGSFEGLANITTPMKKYLPTVKKTLRMTYSPKDIKNIGKAALRISFICQAIIESEESG